LWHNQFLKNKGAELFASPLRVTSTDDGGANNDGEAGTR
jgi:hypothetical protein